MRQFSFSDGVLPDELQCSDVAEIAKAIQPSGPAQVGALSAVKLVNFTVTHRHPNGHSVSMRGRGVARLGPFGLDGTASIEIVAVSGEINLEQKRDGLGDDLISQYVY